MNEEKKAKIKDIIEWIYCIIIAVVLALLVKYFLGTPTIVKQTSMVPTFQPNDRLILNRLYRTFKTTPQRGDIITFEAPTVSNSAGEKVDLENPVAKYTNKTNGLVSKFFYNVVEITKRSYIKRVIGLPGDHVEIKDGSVYINGEKLEENYLSSDVKTESVNGGQYLDIIVPEKTVFVMGDNRPDSIDSRKFGCIPYEKIEGKIVLRFWPLNKFGTVK
jgi:signal peptidase I